LKEYKDFDKDLLTKQQHKNVKKIRENPDIVIRKADKSNTFVILNKDSYKGKLDHILGDATKFNQVQKDPTEKLKKKLNELIDTANNKAGSKQFDKLIGQYNAGYIYGNPKTHKDSENPPLRPIISQIGTPTYDIAKRLNDILSKYTPKEHMVQSTDEFIDILHTTQRTGLLASLDVESLFTNVPVDATIAILLKNAYHHHTLPPPKIPKDLMRQMLKTCTTETPFKHISGDVFLQVDGVSMGSPLGPLFANAYMADLEARILPNIQPDEQPILYCRYMDDIFLLVNNIKVLENIKETYEANSVLRFTFEVEKQKNLEFLDVMIRKYQGKLFTSVHTKPTSSGESMNYTAWPRIGTKLV